MPRSPPSTGSLPCSASKSAAWQYNSKRCNRTTSTGVDCTLRFLAGCAAEAELVTWQQKGSHVRKAIIFGECLGRSKASTALQRANTGLRILLWLPPVSTWALYNRNSPTHQQRMPWADLLPFGTVWADLRSCKTSKIVVSRRTIMVTSRNVTWSRHITAAMWPCFWRFSFCGFLVPLAGAVGGAIAPFTTSSGSIAIALRGR